MQFKSETTANGVTERLFDLTVAGELVPAAIWAPEGAKATRPLVLLGHGGGGHKKAETTLARAQILASKLGYTILAIDAPGHGERVSPEEAAAFTAEVAARVRGLSTAPPNPDGARLMIERANQAIPEWKAALDAALTFDFVGADAPIGYMGLSMGTVIGVPFVAVEPRIQAAVFGLNGLRPGAEAMEAAARAITIPIEFCFQWDDAVASREGGIGLFNAFSSKEKTMHINPGGHVDIPMFERDSWEQFLVRHLGVGAKAGRTLTPA